MREYILQVLWFYPWATLHHYYGFAQVIIEKQNIDLILYVHEKILVNDMFNSWCISVVWRDTHHDQILFSTSMPHKYQSCLISWLFNRACWIHHSIRMTINYVSLKINRLQNICRLQISSNIISLTLGNFWGIINVNF